LKYHILGIEKCGTTSLEEKLKSQGHDVVRHEWAYCFENVKEWHVAHYPDYLPTFILRNPVERCFSDYQYAIKQKQIPNISYEEALIKYPRFAQGSSYSKWLKPFENNIKVLELESLTMNHLNKNSYRDMTVSEIISTINAISNADKTDYSRNDLNLEDYI